MKNAIPSYYEASIALASLAKRNWGTLPKRKNLRVYSSLRWWLQATELYHESAVCWNLGRQLIMVAAYQRSDACIQPLDLITLGIAGLQCLEVTKCLTGKVVAMALQMCQRTCCAPANCFLHPWPDWVSPVAGLSVSVNCMDVLALMWTWFASRATIAPADM